MAKTSRKAAKAPREAPSNWSELLKEATEKPGVMRAAFSQFHDYSLGNCLLAWAQLAERNIPLSPIASFNKWKSLGRMVKRGEKAIILCMPRTFHATYKDADGNEAEHMGVFFVYKPFWFAWEQTQPIDENSPNEPPVSPLPEWDFDTALESLNVKKIPFRMMSGNCLGYATKEDDGQKVLALNPTVLDENIRLAVVFHELGHLVLGHTDIESHERQDYPRSLVECEAEAVAMLILDAMGLPGAEHARAYIQHWYKENEITDKTASRIMTAAQKIMVAGRKKETKDTEEAVEEAAAEAVVEEMELVAA